MSDPHPDKPRRNETNHYATHVDLANWSSLTSENWRDKIRNAKFPEGSGVTMHDISDGNERRRNASAKGKFAKICTGLG